MLTKGFLKLASENIASSFLFGSTTKLLSSSIKGYKLRMPDAYDIRACIKTGGEFAKHAIFYSLNILVLDKVGLPSVLLHLSATFLTAFQLALRNGVNYAGKTATINSITTFLKSLILKR